MNIRRLFNLSSSSNWPAKILHHQACSPTAATPPANLAWTWLTTTEPGPDTPRSGISVWSFGRFFLEVFYSPGVLQQDQRKQWYFYRRWLSPSLRREALPLTMNIVVNDVNVEGIPQPLNRFFSSVNLWEWNFLTWVQRKSKSQNLATDLNLRCLGRRILNLRLKVEDVILVIKL